MRIKLFFDVSRGAEFETIRLKVAVQFRTQTNWTAPYDALLDTGAPAALLPQSLWSAAEHTIVAQGRRIAIAGRVIAVNVGRVTCRLLDERRWSRPLEVYAFLSLRDDVPLILGFKDVLTDFPLFLDYRKRRAYINVRSTR